jgi:hypothetical protein
MCFLEQKRDRLIKHTQTALKFREFEVFSGIKIHIDITCIPKYRAYYILLPAEAVGEGY